MNVLDNIPFDFRIHEGRGAGLKIEVAPGGIKPNEANFINIDERSFRIIERFILNCIPSSINYSHYGVNCIPFICWKSAIEDLESYSKTVLASDNSVSDDWRSMGYEEVAEEFDIRYETTTRGIQMLIKALTDLCLIWAHKHSNIFIYGI